MSSKKSGFKARFFAALRNFHKKLKATFTLSTRKKSEKKSDDQKEKMDTPRKREREESSEGHGISIKKSRTYFAAPSPTQTEPTMAMPELQEIAQASPLVEPCLELEKKEVSVPKEGLKRPRTEEDNEEIHIKRLKCAVPSAEGIETPQPGPSSEVELPIPVDRTLCLGRFTFHKVLGKGSFGKVLLARDLLNEQWVAVKQIKKRPLLNHTGSAKIEKKILELAQDCVFLTRAFGSFQTEDSIYFVMEYAAGGSLFDLCVNGNSMDIEQIRFIAAEVICGLNFLHSRLIIHRDLKLGNILLDGSGHIKIADFGLAVQTRYGLAKGRAGTRGYKAPELTRREVYDCSADYYSLGVMLFYLATELTSIYIEDPRAKVGIDGLDSDLRDIIQKLTCDNRVARRNFVVTIKDHPFFASINWDALEAREIDSPLILPPAKDIPDAVPHKTLISSDKDKTPFTSDQQAHFKGLSFVCKEWGDTGSSDPDSHSAQGKT
ncbi:protein kinase C theta type-like [Xenopus tropicalis]|uniref:Protein kinase C theta type-like n=1 Tax=Xenopus tropicalis TaxID=8364 RepID=A0A8J1JKF3_XENTR|nr:protein kinase C theta type-like [Xenopus tropicalis]